MEGLISVIIPVYNCESYLRECINSVRKQSYSNLEVILIDDGSQDASGVICDEYVRKDRRFRVIHQRNAGVSAARNAGLDIATGTYLFFLDADDVLADNIFEKMLSINTDADLIVGGITEISEDGQENGNKIILPEKILTRQEMLEALFYEDRYGYLGILTPKIYRTNIVQKNRIHFDNQIKYNEDRLFIMEYVLHCEIIQFTCCYYYYYRQRDDSALGQIKNIFKPAALTELDAFEKMKELVEYIDPQLYQHISRLTFEKALYWYNKIPPKFTNLKWNTWSLVKKNARICIMDNETGVIKKIKIIIHCILKR